MTSDLTPNCVEHVQRVLAGLSGPLGPVGVPVQLGRRPKPDGPSKSWLAGPPVGDMLAAAKSSSLNNA